MLGQSCRFAGLLSAGLMTVAMVVAPTAARAEEENAKPKQSATEASSEDTDQKKEGAPFIERVEVKQRADNLVGIATSATEGVTGRADLENRPILRPGELLETVPGVIITQHSGSGKANQYFLRGFNLDHGTDFRVTVADIPVNMPSHGHGQGYADLNFLIPELVDTIQFRKGPYYADEGDFSAAGAARIEYVRTLPRTIADVSGGNFGYGRGLYAGSRPASGGDLLYAGELSAGDGPWDHSDRLRHLNGLMRYSHGDLFRGFSLTAQAYDAHWDSTDQIPLRAVDQGLIDRFGAIDPSDAGRSSRYALSGEIHRGDATASSRLSAYLLDYRLSLFSNFTYFLDDPMNGDQFEQIDRRLVSGLEARHDLRATPAGRTVESAVGVQLRADGIHNGLFSTRDRVQIGTTREDRILELTGGPFAETLIRWNDRVRTGFGLRVDTYHADVRSDLDANSGSRNAAILSPKFSLVLGPWKETEYYVNVGYGFHSNDARGATIQVDPKSGAPVQQVTPLVRAVGADIGFRTSVLPNLQTSLSLFDLDLDSELLFSGDGGTTEASRPSRRAGVEWANFYRPLEWLAIDLDLALTRASFTDSDPVGDRIPGAIGRAISAGVTIRGLRHWSGTLRLRDFGPRALIEDGSVRSRSTDLLESRVGYRFQEGFSLVLDVFNLLDRKVNDIDYFYDSRLPGEPAGGVSDIHFHPVEPRSARLLLDWSF